MEFKSQNKSFQQNSVGIKLVDIFGELVYVTGLLVWLFAVNKQNH